MCILQAFNKVIKIKHAKSTVTSWFNKPLIQWLWWWCILWCTVYYDDDDVGSHNTFFIYSIKVFFLSNLVFILVNIAYKNFYNLGQRPFVLWYACFKCDGFMTEGIKGGRDFSYSLLYSTSACVIGLHSCNFSILCGNFTSQTALKFY